MDFLFIFSISYSKTLVSMPGLPFPPLSFGMRLTDSTAAEHPRLIPKITLPTTLCLIAWVWWVFVLSQFQTHIGRNMLHPM